MGRRRKKGRKEERKEGRKEGREKRREEKNSLYVLYCIVLKKRVEEEEDPEK